jgi:hypothetical protein
VLLLQHPVLVLFLLSSTVVVSPGGWVRRQLCEPLSAVIQAAAHLPHTASWPLLKALFIAVHWGKLSHLPSLAGFVYLECSWVPAPPLKSYKPATVAGFIFKVHAGNCLSPILWWSVLHISHCCNLCSYKVCWGEPPNPPSLAGLFI